LSVEDFVALTNLLA
ncbi:MAG TPA: hypothetical protein DCF48_06115, partial [Rikenellaceae bacterium]|nr:hypothetical protein [Rikenellaceae bacterium]